MEFFNIKVAGVKLEVGQNVQLFVGSENRADSQYDGDFPVVAYDPVTEKAAVDCSVHTFSSVAPVSLISRCQGADEAMYGRVQVRTPAGASYVDLPLKNLVNARYISKDLATGDALVLTKKRTWGDTDRRKAYFGYLESEYPHLTGLLQRESASLTLRAEASLLLAMLLLSEEMKNVRAPSFATERATRIFATLKGKTSEVAALLASPLTEMATRKIHKKALYDTYIGQVRAEVSLLAGKLFKDYFGRSETPPQSLMLAVGNGSCTEGILGKPNEAAGLFSYNFDALGKYEASLKSPTGGTAPVVRFFVTAINSTTAKATATLAGGTKEYGFEVEKDGSSGKFEPKVTTGSVTVRRQDSDGRKYSVRVFDDGATWDVGSNEFTFPPDVFAGEEGAPLKVTLSCDKEVDETLFGLTVMPTYAPLAMLGLYDIDECVPWEPTDPELTDAYEKKQIEAAHILVEACARLANKFTTFKVKMVPGAIGRQVDSEIISAKTTHLNALWLLDADAKQQLRASFLLPRVVDGALQLEIRSFTDPDYDDSQATKNYKKTMSYNLSLSARRCWGILGLLVKKLHALDPEKAQKAWRSAVSDTTPAGRAGYLEEDPTFLADMGLA